MGNEKQKLVQGKSKLVDLSYLHHFSFWVPIHDIDFRESHRGILPWSQMEQVLGSKILLCYDYCCHYRA